MRLSIDLATAQDLQAWAWCDRNFREQHSVSRPRALPRSYLQSKHVGTPRAQGSMSESRGKQGQSADVGKAQSLLQLHKATEYPTPS